MVKERLAREHAAHVAAEGQAQAARRARRASTSSTPPPSLVEDEFDQRLEDDRGRPAGAQSRTFADEDTTEEKAKEEYRGIAERRVRLGLVIAEIGEKNNIKVTDEELQPRRGGARAPVSRPGAGGLGVLPQQSARRWRACARRSSRTRWSISCSSSPRSPTRRCRARSSTRKTRPDAPAAPARRWPCAGVPWNLSDEPVDARRNGRASPQSGAIRRCGTSCCAPANLYMLGRPARFGCRAP